MKFSATLALAVIVGLVATSSAFPAQKSMCEQKIYKKNLQNLKKYYSI